MFIVDFKRVTQTVLLLIVLIFSTKFFQSTPFEILFFQLQAIFLGLILIFILFFMADIFVKHKSLKKEVLYFMLLILFMPLYSAFRAYVEFGQPYVYGLLSERNWLLLGVGIWFYYMISTKKIALITLELSFLIMAWMSLIVFSLVTMTFDPSQLIDVENFVRLTENRGLRFHFQNVFITFGSLYYFIKYTMYKKPLDLIILFAFLSYVVFIVQGRTYMLFLAMTYLLYYFFNYPMNEFIVKIIKVLLLFLSFLVLVQIFIPDFIERMSELFVQMFTVLTGEMSQDSSSNARIWQSLIVFDYFDTHPMSILFGTGKVSHQWNGGYEAIFGYFYPSDIGLLGGTFLYGILGIVLLMLIPLIWQVKEIKKVKTTENVFIMTIKYLLIMYILHLPQGGLYLGGGSFMYFFILYAINRLDKGKYAI